MRNFNPFDLDKFVKARGEMSQAKFAERIGVTQGHIGHIESGRRCPSFFTLAKYAEVVNQPIDFFIKPRKNLALVG